MNFLKNRFTRLQLLVFLLTISGVGAGAQIFSADWSGQNDRTWLGADYWAGPMQDWRIRGGKLECIHDAKQRTVQLLSFQTTPESSLEMSVVIEQPPDDFRGHAGFIFGISGNQNDYRHNAIWGKGVSAGLWKNGELHMGGKSAKAGWEREVTLKLSLTPSAGGSHTAVLSAVGGDGKVLGTLENELPSAKIAGNIALELNGNGNMKKIYGEAVVRFSEWKIDGNKLSGGIEQRWGPILWTQYTLSGGVLKLQAQMAPMGAQDPVKARLDLRRGGKWERAAEAVIDPLSRTVLFRLENWQGDADAAYRVCYPWQGGESALEGTIRRDPIDGESLSVAGFTGNKDFGFPNSAIVGNLKRLDPDILFFSGDQIYEEVARFGIVRSPVERATLDYLRKWYLFGWSFRDLLKDRPSVILPDDHDVYQGNLWGAGGRKAPGDFASGGYVMAPEWVNMIQRTQTGHMPDPYDPTPVGQGIGVYYGNMTYGGVSFAILEDRKFKTGPGQVPAEIPEEKAQQLGERQLAFLETWAADWKDAFLKATLSQTVFAQCHTYGGKKKKTLTEDKDANGWPPAARNESIRSIRKAFAFMYAGDNHLPTVAHHGIDDWEDAGVSFTVPSIAAGFPREWRPDQVGHERKGPLPEHLENLYGGEIPAWIGRYTSSWGHPLTMIAVANPVEFTNQGSSLKLLDDKSSGFGLVRFNKLRRSYTVECYRILADLDKPESAQFNGWPVSFEQDQMYGRRAKAWLPKLTITGIEHPVVQVIAEKRGETVYTLRIGSEPFSPKVFDEGSYTVRIGDGTRWLKELKGVRAGEKGAEEVNVAL